jgi:alcohol dehydrogenase, propanol-preferring
MRAQILRKTGSIDSKPLEWAEIPVPQINADEILVRIAACGVCHTDLHVVEGDLPNPRLPIVPGHQIVGVVEEVGAEVTDFEPGARAGIPWLHETCGLCEFCQRGLENLCEKARFTGYTANGGYAEYIKIRADYAVALPDGLSDAEMAPLLCAGIVGYRSLRLADVAESERIGLYGFGASAHICIQIARYWGCEVFVFTRSAEHQQHALDLGAAWAGSAGETPPARLDRAVLFAPAGWIVPLALKQLRPGGTLAINAIHASPIPEMPYALLWEERTIRSVANATRQDAREFMALAAAIPIKTDVQTFPLAEANAVLQRVKHSQINGAAVLIP